eukprot:TRINITY_DN13962_c0_g1_i1.p1 TRINITY_DN13962_c0_g1~~TRINITY_DN13962_c0_g1_i1.p1  ORF type:complete len:355 (+),score=70.48 TRINITY_DN13962_c0_g1_i1:82-1146(+)
MSILMCIKILMQPGDLQKLYEFLIITQPQEYSSVRCSAHSKTNQSPIKKMSLPLVLNLKNSNMSLNSVETIRKHIFYLILDYIFQPNYHKDFIKFVNVEMLLVFLQSDNKKTRIAALKLLHICMKEESIAKELSTTTSAFVIGQRLSQQSITHELMCVLLCILLGKSSQPISSNSTVFSYFINVENLDVIKYPEFLVTICLTLETCESPPKLKRDVIKILYNIFLFSEENKKIMLQHELPILLCKLYCEELKHHSENPKQDESDLIEVIVSLIKTCVLHVSTTPPYDTNSVVWLTRIFSTISSYQDISRDAKLHMEISIVHEIIDFFYQSSFISTTLTKTLSAEFFLFLVPVGF